MNLHAASGRPELFHVQRDHALSCADAQGVEAATKRMELWERPPEEWELDRAVNVRSRRFRPGETVFCEFEISSELLIAARNDAPSRRHVESIRAGAIAQLESAGVPRAEIRIEEDRRHPSRDTYSGCAYGRVVCEYCHEPNPLCGEETFGPNGLHIVSCAAMPENSARILPDGRFVRPPAGEGEELSLSEFLNLTENMRLSQVPATRLEQVTQMIEHGFITPAVGRILLDGPAAQTTFNYGRGLSLG